MGEHLGRYEVVRKLATGGMAEIYLARMRGAAGFEKLCVLKRILPSVASEPRLVEMFLDEARLSATLRHPNIADVFDLGTDNGSYFFAMEFIHGQDARLLRMRAHAVQRPIPLEISLAVIHGVAAALAYAHDKIGPSGPLDVVHRDISPGNILISYDGAVKLVDFGIARASSRSAETKSGSLKGKIPYMSPEQCRGQRLDRRSDLFSLGIVLYELTVGCRPFRGNSEFGIMERIVNRPPRPPSTVIHGYPADLERIVHKLLDRDLAHRYQSAQDLLADLEAFTDKHQLAATQLTLAKYMRSLFPGEVAAWERAALDGTSLAQHLAETSATPVVRKSQDSPAYGALVVRHRTEAEAPRTRRPTEQIEDDDVVQTSEVPQLEEATVEQRSPFRRDELAAVERKLGVGDMLGSPRVPSRDFTMDDPTHQARPADAAFLVADRTSADLVRPFDPIEEYRADILDQVANETPENRFDGLVGRAWASHEEGEHEKAVVAIELALSEEPDEMVGAEVLDRHADTITTVFEAFLGDRTRHPALSRQLEDLACLPIAPRAAFLLSRIDGMVSIDDLIDISGMPRQDACRHLCQLALLGILQ